MNIFLHEPATLPLRVVVINWGCSSPSDVSSDDDEDDNEDDDDDIK